MASGMGSKVDEEERSAEAGVEGVRGVFLLLGLECLRDSSVVSWRAATHDDICCSLMVWKRCSLDGVKTCGNKLDFKLNS